MQMKLLFFFISFLFILINSKQLKVKANNYDNLIQCTQQLRNNICTSLKKVCAWYNSEVLCSEYNCPKEFDNYCAACSIRGNLPIALGFTPGECPKPSSKLSRPTCSNCSHNYESNESDWNNHSIESNGGPKIITSEHSEHNISPISPISTKSPNNNHSGIQHWEENGLSHPKNTNINSSLVISGNEGQNNNSVKNTQSISRVVCVGCKGKKGQELSRCENECNECKKKCKSNDIECHNLKCNAD